MAENLKIYCFSLFDTGYISVHSLIRELFDSPNTVCPSLSQGDLLYVLSKKPPTKSLHHNSRTPLLIDKKTQEIELKSHVAFCNRHRGNITPKKIYPKEALNKFCLLSGLRQKKSECRFLGPHNEKKFNIHNAFSIEGLFNITDYNKFNEVLKNGIGSRKSYGYGLILTKQGGEYESAN